MSLPVLSRLVALLCGLAIGLNVSDVRLLQLHLLEDADPVPKPAHEREDPAHESEDPLACAAWPACT